MEENVEGMDSRILESLEGAKILAGANYDLKNETCDQSYFHDIYDCVCNQPCHGEGPCYSL